jgi:hypothetical protein
MALGCRQALINLRMILGSGSKHKQNLVIRPLEMRSEEQPSLGLSGARGCDDQTERDLHPQIDHYGLEPSR